MVLLRGEKKQNLFLFFFKTGFLVFHENKLKVEKVIFVGKEKKNTTTKTSCSFYGAFVELYENKLKGRTLLEKEKKKRNYKIIIFLQ